MKSKEVPNVPELRFPEFKDSGKWEEKPLRSYLLQHPDYGVNAPAVPYSEKLATYLRITDISEDGYYIQNEKVSVDIDVTSNNYLEDGDIVLARTGASVGKSYKYKKEDGALVFAGFLIRIKPDSTKLNSNLLFQFLSTEKYWKWVGIMSVRGGQPGINGNEYASLPIPTPPTLEEQQKIADCLSSVDNLIAAQTQKREALKEHKKALMQQLFPQDNEETPKLRFPEFKDSGEWERKNGNLVFDQISNKKHNSDLPILAITQEYGAVPRNMIEYHVSVTNRSVESYKVVEVNDFIISLRSFQGGIEFSKYKGICSPAYIILRKKIDLKEQFFKYYFKTHKFIQDLNKNLEGIRDGKMVSYKQFSDLLLPLPTIQEQQKIADCLSSVDNLIAAQTQKVEALKEHKKGLMQQLFPSGEV